MLKKSLSPVNEQASTCYGGSKMCLDVKKQTKSPSRCCAPVTECKECDGNGVILGREEVQGWKQGTFGFPEF